MVGRDAGWTSTSHVGFVGTVGLKVYYIKWICIVRRQRMDDARGRIGCTAAKMVLVWVYEASDGKPPTRNFQLGGMVREISRTKQPGVFSYT